VPYFGDYHGVDPNAYYAYRQVSDDDVCERATLRQRASIDD